MTFTESSLKLTFNPVDWEVIAYDRHRYYNALKGAGLRGVDFLGIWREDTLVLLEIKSFRVRPAEQSALAIQELLERPDMLVEAMTEKKKDTLRGLEGIEGFLRRSWWYRFMEPRFLKWKPRWRKYFPQAFWARVFARRGRICTVLWLETDLQYSGWDESKVDRFRDHLRQGLAKEGIELAGNGHNPFGSELKVLH